MTMRRRQFLQVLGGAAAGLALGPRWLHALPAADSTTRRLVLVLLDGGNDGLNTLVPFGDDHYHRLRPALALDPRRVHRIDEHFGWHPSLAKLARRYGEGQVAAVQNVGYANPNLSHFRSMDIWESGSLAQPLPTAGWMGRLVDERRAAGSSPMELLAVGELAAPLSQRAQRHTPYAVPGRDAFRIRDGGRMEALLELNALDGTCGAAAAARAVHSASLAQRQMEAALGRKAHSTYPDSRLAGDLELCARAIESDLPVSCFHVRQGGYDTHANQAEPHAALLETLDGALDAFLADLEAFGALERTLVLVVSEFGRRAAENGIGATAGTDHGAASIALMLGAAGGSKGLVGGLHGSPPRLDALDGYGNLVHEIDFRRVYADVVEGWFGLKSADVLGAAFEPFGAVRA